MVTIESYCMNWNNGVMTHTFIDPKTGEQKTTITQALPVEASQLVASAIRKANNA